MVNVRVRNPQYATFYNTSLQLLFGHHFWIPKPCTNQNIAISNYQSPIKTHRLATRTDCDMCRVTFHSFKGVMRQSMDPWIVHGCTQARVTTQDLSFRPRVCLMVNTVPGYDVLPSCWPPTLPDAISSHTWCTA